MVGSVSQCVVSLLNTKILKFKIKHALKLFVLLMGYLHTAQAGLKPTGSSCFSLPSRLSFYCDFTFHNQMYKDLGDITTKSKMEESPAK